MAGDGTSCSLPDGTVVDLTNATPEEVQACLSGAGATLRLEELADPEPPARVAKKKHMDPKPETTEVPDAGAPAASPPAAPAAETATLTAHEEQPDSPPAPATASSEIGQLLQSTGGGALGLIAALIAVVGGTAGFKLWTKISEQKHEQSMKKLDIEQANAGLQGAQPPPCQAAHHTLVAEIKALQARVVALEGRVEKAEKATAGFDPSVDVGDLEERVEVLEKALRKKARAAEGTH
jgi:hypothetical protein